MSWSINMMGKGADVAAQAEKELTGCKCEDPEESVKRQVLGIIQAHGAAMPDKGMHVSGYGSMSCSWDGEWKVATVDSMIVKLEITTAMFAQAAPAAAAAESAS